MTDPDQQFPDNFQLSYTNPIRLCGRSTDGLSCDSVIFTTNGISYQQEEWRVRGYQFYSLVIAQLPAPLTFLMLMGLP